MHVIHPIVTGRSCVTRDTSTQAGPFGSTSNLVALLLRGVLSHIAGDVVLMSPFAVHRMDANHSEHARWSVLWTYQNAAQEGPSIGLPSPQPRHTHADPDTAARDIILRSFTDIDREVQSAKEWAELWPRS